MSTRCQILVEGSDVVLYRHSDGYPTGESGVLKPLKKIVSQFCKHRGFDTTYLPAHIISSFIVDQNKWIDEHVAKGSLERDYAGTRFLGHGVEAYYPDRKNTGLHGDIDYLYVVKRNGTIEVREPMLNFGEDGECRIQNTKMTSVVKYARKTTLTNV